MNKKDDIQPLLEEIKQVIGKIYGKRLKGIILYGSYARGEATEGSDIDLLILVENVEDPWEERGKFADFIWKLDLKYNTVISILPVDEKSYQTQRKPIFLNAKREGILL
jgi:predicted nucleotidyltransferase